MAGRDKRSMGGFTVAAGAAVEHHIARASRRAGESDLGEGKLDQGNFDQGGFREGGFG